MKNLPIILFIVILSIFTSCKTDKTEDYIIISGKIENPNSTSFSILNRNQDLIKIIQLEKDDSFRDTLYVSEGYFSLTDGKENKQIYLKPKFDLDLTINTKDFDESIFYTGVGSNENNYLAEKYLLGTSFGELDYYGYYAKLNEREFLKLTDSLYNVRTNLLNNYANLDDDFIFLESKSLEFGKLIKYSEFEKMKWYVGGDKDFRVSGSFPDPFVNIDLSNEKLLNSPAYLSFIQAYLSEKTIERISRNDESLDYSLENIFTIKEEVGNKKIQEELAYYMGKWRLTGKKNVSTIFNELVPLLTNRAYLNVVTLQYEKLKKMEKGAISPSFILKDINDNDISLNQLKGKLVYIDIWATWCLPCIQEIPSLKKMEEHFSGKDIHFVSMCYSDELASWKGMVEEKELGGIQLFAPDENIPFFKDYSVEGVPRFILIDKDGRIIDSAAKKPSHPKLIEEIEKYL